MLAIASHALSAEPPKEYTNSIGMKFKLIPAGEFLMGSPESESAAESAADRDGKPQHKVRITKPFYLGVYEVTLAEYEKVMGKNPSGFGEKYANRMPGKDMSLYPVEAVSWDEAVEFCKKLSAQEGKNYRLPSEAEWEYACRAGTTTKWYCGDNVDELVRFAWYREISVLKTHPVGAKEPTAWGSHPVGTREANDWGLFDMHGNVWEWCHDSYGHDYYSDEATDPTGLPEGSDRVYRGSSWVNVATFCRSSLRNWHDPKHRFRNLGFRVALVPSASPDKSSK
jgi:formylglycine-generating enzyme required for sulfatase activity